MQNTNFCCCPDDNHISGENRKRQRVVISHKAQAGKQNTKKKISYDSRKQSSVFKPHLRLGWE